MSIWSSLFSTGDIVEKGVDAMISAGDKLVFTDEERMDMNLKMREHHLKLLEASQPFKVAQRLLAVWFSLLFGLTFLIGLGMTGFNIVHKFMEAKAGVAKEDIHQLDISGLLNIVNVFDLGIIMITVVGFYFGGALIKK